MSENSGLGGLADKAKGLVDDDKIDQAAEAAKDKTPEQADGAIDKAAEQAKKFNA